MNHDLLDIYSDYLLSSFSQTTATGLSRLVDGQLGHDQVTRFLSSEAMDSKAWWKIIKPTVRQIQSEEGVLTIDDSISEKPHTDENDIICWHYDHSKGTTVKGINFITALYGVEEVTLPVNLRIIEKTVTYTDKQGKEKRRSDTTKNEHYREMLAQCIQNQIPFRYVLNDSWFASAENMRCVKLDHQKEFIMAMKKNRKVALSVEDKAKGRFQSLESLHLPEETPMTIFLEAVSFPVNVMRQGFTNKDGSTGERYLVTSDLGLKADEIATIYKKRWKVEEYHRSLKQNASLSKSPTKTKTTQTNHFMASLWAYVKLELLKVQTKKNHYALKSRLYIRALKQAYDELRAMKTTTLAHLSA